MSALDLLASRRSTPSRLLGPPGPDDAAIHAMLRHAVRVPDHGKLVPWRFLLVRGQARQRLGDLLAERRQAIEPAATDAVLAKDRQRFSHAPVILVVVGRLDPDHRIPVQEQLLSGGCVCFALLLAAQGLGFGAQWLTGWAAYDRAIASALGLGEHERVLGFIHLGTPQEPAQERPRPEPASLLEEWHG